MAGQTVNRSTVRPRDPATTATPPPGGNGERVPATAMPIRAFQLGSIQDLHILNEQGEVDRAHDPQLPEADLLKIHRAMVLTRKLDIRMLNMQRQGEMGTFAPGLGQEATQIGQVFPLAKDDWFAPSYRSFGAQIWRGWPIDQLLLLWDGFFEGFAPPPGVNDLPFSIVIGSHLPPAVGVAQAIQYRTSTPPYHAVLTNFGDGAMSQGAVNEAFNFAAVSKAPVVFVCENNGWAISMPVEKQAATPTLAQRGIGFGIPSIRVDGNDVLAVIVAARAAIDRARSGGGPTLIEAVTYRMSLHTTADDPKVYRNEEQVQEWEAKCPILRFEKYLIKKGVLDRAGCERVAAECEQQVLEARDSFRKKAIAKPREVFDFVYEELTPELEAQRREYFERLKRKGIVEQADVSAFGGPLANYGSATPHKPGR
jgi:pyruvate dehydrogenase E1 component alpha subunit